MLFIDPEDDEGGIVGRLLLLGLDAASISERFHYVRPEESLDAPARVELRALMTETRPTLAVIDGVTEAMVLHGLDPLSNKDVAKFGRMLPRLLTEFGAAVVAADHVTKSSEGRGRYAIGAVHKLNGVNGACYILENRTAFGVGRTGRSTLLIAKDRPGQLRKHAFPSKNGLFWYADFVMDSHTEGFNEAAIDPPTATKDTGFRPTAVMAKISKVLDNQPGLSRNAIETTVGGKRDVVRLALELLTTEGFVRTENGARRSVIHFNVKTFES